MKKLLKTILCVMLTTALLLPTAVYGAAASEGSSKDTTSASEAFQPQDADQNEKGEKKDIVILYTSDIHCGVDKGFGFAGRNKNAVYRLVQDFRGGRCDCRNLFLDHGCPGSRGVRV